MSVLQCVSVALRSSMSKMENSMPLSHSRLHALHQKHMMETLKCVLQMDSYLHVAASWSVTGMDLNENKLPYFALLVTLDNSLIFFVSFVYIGVEKMYCFYLTVSAYIVAFFRASACGSSNSLLKCQVCT